MDKAIAITGIFTFALVPAGLGSASIVNFNDINQFPNGFAGFQSGSQLSAVASGGLDNSGLVSTNGNASSNIAVYQTAVDATTFTEGAKVGGYFLYDGGNFVSRPVTFGFTSGATDTYASSDGTTGSDIRVSLVGSGGTSAGVRLRSAEGLIAQSSLNVPLVNNANDPDDGWYYLELTIGGLDTNTGQFTGVTGILYDSDSSGNLGNALKTLDDNGNGGYTTLASGLASDTEVYAYFGGFSPGGQSIDGFDNFTVTLPDTNPIPEPASAALVALGGLAMLHRRRA